MDGKMLIIFQKCYQAKGNKLVLCALLLLLIVSSGCIINNNNSHKEEYVHFYDYYKVGKMNLFPAYSEDIIRTRAILYPSLLTRKHAGFLVFKREENDSIINHHKGEIFYICDDSLNVNFHEDLSSHRVLSQKNIIYSSGILKEIVMNEMQTLINFKQLNHIPCRLNYSLKSIQDDTIKISYHNNEFIMNIYRISGVLYDQKNNLNIYWQLLVENKENNF